MGGGLLQVTCPACGRKFAERNLAVHCRSNPQSGHLEALKQIHDKEIRDLKSRLQTPDVKPRVPSPQEAGREVVRASLQGQPPNFGTLEVTVDRSEALGCIKSLIGGGGGPGRYDSLFLLGDPGAGKTHLLNCAREIAGREGFLVFQTGVVECGVLPSDEARFARALFRGIRFPFLLSERGRRDIVLKLALESAELEAEKAAQELTGTRMPSGSEVRFQLRQALSRANIGQGVFSRMVRDWADAALEGGLLEFDIPEMTLGAFADESVDFARRLGFRGAVFLVDELEEARQQETYSVLDSLVGTEDGGARWIFAANEDLLTDPDRGILRLAPSLGAKIQKSSVGLERLTSSELKELARILLSAFKEAFPNLPPGRYFSEEETDRVAREYGTKRAKTREFTTTLLSQMRAKKDGP